MKWQAGDKKWRVFDFTCKPFDKLKCQCFVSGILLLNMLNSNRGKLKKYNFEEKKIREGFFACYSRD